MDHVLIFVENFYNHTWYYPFMPDEFRQAVDQAHENGQEAVMVKRADLESMFAQYLLRLSN